MLSLLSRVAPPAPSGRRADDGFLAGGRGGAGAGDLPSLEVWLGKTAVVSAWLRCGIDDDDTDGDGPVLLLCLGAVCGLRGGGGTGIWARGFSPPPASCRCVESMEERDSDSSSVGFDGGILDLVSDRAWPRRGGGAGAGFLALLGVATSGGGESVDESSSEADSIPSPLGICDVGLVSSGTCWCSDSGCVGLGCSPLMVLPWRELGGGGGTSFLSLLDAEGETTRWSCCGLPLSLLAWLSSGVLSGAATILLASALTDASPWSSADCWLPCSPEFPVNRSLLKASTLSAGVPALAALRTSPSSLCCRSSSSLFDVSSISCNVRLNGLPGGPPGAGGAGGAAAKPPTAGLWYGGVAVPSRSLSSVAEPPKGS